ncbi:SH3 domain-containing protein [Streptomyces sp. NPDC091292]|uniref:SH3 domain-containing protein n=1 Tax=Streptomyces sp. NPDC091292 TaxID=3365991 RepID=UPI003828DAB2
MPLAPRSLRTLATRLGTVAAGGALAAVTVLAGAGGATAAEPGPDPRPGADGEHGQGYGNGGREHDRYPIYKGRVTADGGLILRDRPDRGARILRVEPRGAIVSIFCKSNGERVEGTRLWYLLTDGTWAWGSARYIDNIGKVPRWC